MAIKRPKIKTFYGFNSELEKELNSKIFVFPMPGTPCRREQGHNAMKELVAVLNS
jgi:hypothetical protein